MDLRVRYQPVTEDISDDDEEVEKGQKTNKTDISLHNWWPWRPWALQCVSSMENEKFNNIRVKLEVQERVDRKEFESKSDKSMVNAKTALYTVIKKEPEDDYANAGDVFHGAQELCLEMKTEFKGKIEIEDTKIEDMEPPALEMENKILDNEDLDKVVLNSLNLTEDHSFGQAETQTYLNPDFFEFFPELGEFHMQPIFANNPQSPPYSQHPTQRPPFTSSSSPSYNPYMWDDPTYTFMQMSPSYRSASSPQGPTSPSYNSASSIYNSTCPTYQTVSPSYSTGSQSLQTASPPYRSQPYRPLPPMTMTSFPPSPPHEQPIHQNYPTYISPPPSGRSSPYDRNAPISSSSFAFLGFEEAENLPRYSQTPVASPVSGPESQEWNQEFSEITNMDSFARYLLDITTASNIYDDKDQTSVTQPAASQSQEHLNHRTFKDCQDLRGSPSSKPQEHLNPPRPGGASQEAPQGIPSKPVCSQCGTRETSLWRRDSSSGKPLCNACKLYFKVCI